jgi:Cupin-like domain
MITRQTRSIDGADVGSIDWAALLDAQEPVIFRGLARDWPLVAAGQRGPADAIANLKAFEGGPPVVRYQGAAEIGGRFFYDPSMTAMNFKADRAPLDHVLDDIEHQIDDSDAPSVYVGSTDVDIYLPGFRAANDLGLNDPMFAANPPIVSIWLGTKTTAATHYDYSNNIACCLVGRRRFTLFPPDQIANLYPGPLEPTPGGQVVSLVDVAAPDLGRFPRFADAAAAGQVAELNPGDVLFYPAMWWHQVEARDRFNAMMNYWWNTSPAFVDTPMNTLLHGLLSLRDRPDAEKSAWRHVFDYYIFGPADAPRVHIPEAAQGALAPFDERRARRLRATLLDKLNR